MVEAPVPQQDASPTDAPADGTAKKGSKLKLWLHGKNSWFARFARQELKGWTPIISANFVVFVYLLAAIILLPLGIAILVASLNVEEHRVRYDNAGNFSRLESGAARAEALNAAGGAGVPVVVTVDIPKTMKPPIYVYYDLDSYYQNYRRYVRSLDSKQLGGKNSSSSACDPIQYVGDKGSNAGLQNNGKINPCGLIAWSNFNDTFSLSAGAQPLPVDDSDIAWHYDRDHLYGHYNATNYNGNTSTLAPFRGGNATTTFIDESQHFMVWMRPSVHSTVRKLYGVVTTTIPAGTSVTVTVQNRYNTYGYGGKKYVVLSENSWVGGKNNFLGILFIVLGGLALLVALAFFVAYHLGVVKRRKYGDLSELSWNKNKRT